MKKLILTVCCLLFIGCATNVNVADKNKINLKCGEMPAYSGDPCILADTQRDSHDFYRCMNDIIFARSDYAKNVKRYARCLERVLTEVK